MDCTPGLHMGTLRVERTLNAMCVGAGANARAHAHVQHGHLSDREGSDADSSSSDSRSSDERSRASSASPAPLAKRLARKARPALEEMAVHCERPALKALRTAASWRTTTAVIDSSPEPSPSPACRRRKGKGDSSNVT